MVKLYTPEDSGWIEIQWWRAVYTHGDDRKHGPWFATREDAQDWARHAPNVSKAMLRTVRYEPTVVGAMTADVAEVLERGTA